MENSYEKYVGVVFDGRYRIEKVIGLGGMAVVFKAVDIAANRVVALKLLREDMAQEEESVKRFINESKAVAMLSHPNIVKIFAVSVKEDHKYIVMEYIEGITLKMYIQRKKILSTREIVAISTQILSALDHAHQKSIVHRDIKPQNIMLLKNGQVKVTDFGIAKLPNAETVTMTDKAIGTVFYISPEQASGQPIDARSDLYSLGVSMYEMATGELPFNAESPVSVALMQVNEKAVEPTAINPEMPKGLEQIILAAMEKNPDERYQSAEEMLQNIKKLHENPAATFKNPHKMDAEGGLKGAIKQIFKSGSMLPVILGVTVPFVIIFIICGCILFSSIINTESKAETVTIPKFVGEMYTAELEDWFENSDIYKLEIKYQYDTEYEDGYIISQTPKEGSKRKVEAGVDFCDIVLTVSGSEGDKKVPNIIAYDNRKAQLTLNNAGIKFKLEQIADNTYPSGQVVKTEPAAGETISSDSVLIVYVSTGPETGDKKVPDLVGKSEAEALHAILEAGLRMGKATYERSDKKQGTVITQSVEKDTEVAPNTKIDLVISGGANYDPSVGFNTTEETTTAAPETTTAAPETTAKAPETTKTEETTKKEETTKAEETTKKEETSANTTADSTSDTAEAHTTN